MINNKKLRNELFYKISSNWTLILSNLSLKSYLQKNSLIVFLNKKYCELP